MSEIRVTNVIGENGSSPVNFTQGINMSGIVTATAFIPTTGQLSHRNLLTNGAMQINQRGNLTVSNSNASRQYGGPDRFHQYYYASSEEARYNFNQGGFNDSPFEQGFTNVAHIDVTTADTSIGADHAIWTSQRVEAYDASHLKYGHSDAVSVTLSFWIKSTITGTYSICYGHTNMDERYITTYTVNVANTWEKKTITIPGDTRSGKNISPSNGYGLEVKWVWMSGTNRVATPNEWATQGNKYGASGVTLANIFSSTSNNLYLTGCQLEVGSVATPYEHRSFGDELRRCQRYCFRLGGSIGGNADVYTCLCFGIHSNATQYKGHVQHPVPMRSKDVTFTASNITLDDDVASYNAGNFSSIDNSNTTSSFDNSTVIMNTSNYGAGAGRVSRVLVSVAGGYLQGECEL